MSDPVAEIMRLVDEFAGRVEARVDNNKARAVVESALRELVEIDPADRERAKVIAEAFEHESTLSLNQGDPMYHDLIEAAALLRKAYLR